ncbi:MAG TPA: tetratricopeptide repeat protein [Sphingomicrobium sp.]|nr:tetratricopeptide repeat protein [Sphingomicrobium sp.]
MALTPDTPNDPGAPNEAFLREVDENLRRDRVEQFAKQYGKWLIAAVILFLIAVAAWLYWQNRQQKQAAAHSEELMAIYNDIGAGKIDAAKKKLQPLEDSDSDAVRALTLLTEASIALDANDSKTALAKYHAIAADDDLPAAYRNLGTIRATAIEFDKLKPEEVIARLEPMTKPGEPWFGSAGEMTAMAYLKQGQKDKAGRLFAAIAADQQVPETIRNRAVQIAGTLGVDASASAPPPAKPGSSE